MSWKRILLKICAGCQGWCKHHQHMWHVLVPLILPYSQGPILSILLRFPASPSMSNKERKRRCRSVFRSRSISSGWRWRTARSWRRSASTSRPTTRKFSQSAGKNLQVKIIPPSGRRSIYTHFRTPCLPKTHLAGFDVLFWGVQCKLRPHKRTENWMREWTFKTWN